ncbi:MAG: alpha-glucan family phosphorylase [Trueperaceae bacterium]|nr:alpha-glucan family phosphorylase [Trueperaceae bacterium]
MNILGRLTVLPHVPEPLAPLEELARNLYWTWSPSVRALFRRLDRSVWEASGHNPVALLRDVTQERLDEAARDAAYVEEVQRAYRTYRAYVDQASWFDREVGEEHVYAYFCAEYGWHEAVALYSGGLGVLAGDHTKAASDLGVPLVGVGLFYPEGYFHQRIARDGSQKAVYERHEPTDLPLKLVTDDEGQARVVKVQAFGRELAIRAWRADVGRVPVYLLDVDLPANAPQDRALARRLYGGDQRTRIAQEIVLGIGGVRMLRAIGIAPTSWHMNEGHSAFMALERCRELVAQGHGFAAAREAVAAGTAFTVHTPVAAGNDAFPFELVDEAFGGWWNALGVRQHDFHGLGHADHGWGPVFSMPALALRMSTARNGVARLHGQTSRRIWNDLWPEVPSEEVPISHVTNGVHAATWLSFEVDALLDELLPEGWRVDLSDADMFAPVREVDPVRLWKVRRTLKAGSVRFLRRRVLRQLERQEASPTAKHGSRELFDPEALTIGFARRFATYKRATLIFHDLDRLAGILSDPDRPVQLVFAGKAHPADGDGQALIQRIDELSRDPRFAGRILFIEDYDMAVGRALTRGVDVWLNTPRRPLEASGTSGQKAAMNGVLNLSVLDGWWPEGYDGENGWAIGNGAGFENASRADEADADALYDLLEREVVPLYYHRDGDGVPRAWMARAAQAIGTVLPQFNAQRMVKDYVRQAYAPTSQASARMAQDGYAPATALAAWKKHVREHWGDVFFDAEPAEGGVRRVGDQVEVTAVLNPRQLSDVELRVEVVYGPESGSLSTGLRRVSMEEVERYDDGGVLYRARFRPDFSGRVVYGVRVLPVHEDLASPFDAGAIRWAS